MFEENFSRLGRRFTTIVNLYKDSKIERIYVHDQ